MKKNKTSKKLNLNRSTVANLNRDDLTAARGGVGITDSHGHLCDCLTQDKNFCPTGLIYCISISECNTLPPVSDIL